MPEAGRPVTLRQLNRQAVLDIIRQEGPHSRADLARRLALSKAAISATVNELLAAGVLTQSSATARGPGRRPTLLHLNDATDHVAGIDLGGTQIRVAVADLSGHPLARQRGHTAAARGAHAVLNQIARLVTQAASTAGTTTSDLAAIVMGTPGALHPTSGRLLAAPNLPGMGEIDLPAELARRLGRAVTIENDVNLAALGEQAVGALRDVADACFIAVGTGLGGATIAGGQLLRGASGLAGEIGYLRLDPASRQTLEEVVSGPALAQAYAQHTSRHLTPAQVLAEALAGEPAARRCLAHLLDHLAIAITAAAAFANPQVVLIGGGLGMALDPFLERVRGQVADALPDPPRIELSALGEDAALHGALALALQEGWPRLLQHRLTRSRATPPAPQ